MFVNLAENDVCIPVDQGFRIVGAVFFGLFCAPGHYGISVTEVGVQSGPAQVGRLRGGRSGLYLVHYRLHVIDIFHSQFRSLGKVKPVLLPVVAAVYL